MKENNIFTVDTDVTEIHCDVVNAKIVISPAEDEKFAVTYSNGKNTAVACGDGEIIISQRKRALFVTPKQEIRISVPSHTVPYVKITGKYCELTVSGGLYGELYLSCDDGSVTLDGCACEGLEIAGGDISAHFANLTVKSGAFVKLDKGDLLAENTFITRTECRVRRGNLGLVNLNCKSCVFDAKKGNITVSLAGAETDFNVTLIARDGTVSRESCKHDGAEGNFQAVTGKGNIVLDFTIASTETLFEEPAAESAADSEAAATDADGNTVEEAVENTEKELV